MKSRIYGPVPSRRLGYSLGIDCVPLKTCSYNCIYCQLRTSAPTTITRKPYVPVDAILDQLQKKLSQEIHPDYITLGGSGEPTLHSEIDRLIGGIKKQTQIPVAVLTNGSMLSDSTVQQSLLEADVVLPSLDAHDDIGFKKINRPHPSITFSEMVGGLTAFRKNFSGQIWLEIFLLEGINDTDEDARRFKTLIAPMAPDKIHLNTAVRPTAEAMAKRLGQEKMEAFRAILGEKAEVACNLEAPHETKRIDDMGDELFSLLARRPCTKEDLATGLRVSQLSILKGLERLREEGKIETVHQGDKVFYQLSGTDGS